MATDSISAALAAVIEERDRIRDEIQSLEGQLQEVEAAISSLDRLTSDGAGSGRRGRARTSGQATRQGGRSSGATARGGRRTGPRTGPTMVSLIESFVGEQGRKAIHGDEILQHLESINRAPGGKNPKATLQTTLQQLQKRGRVTNIGRNRWRIVRSGSSSSGNSNGTAGSEERDSE